MASDDPTPVAAPVTRRQLLRTGMYATVGLFFGTAVAGGSAMVWPLKTGGFGASVPAPKRVSEINPGDVVRVSEGKYYLTRTEDGLLALYWRCVHLGCTVPWVPSEHLFICPCHGARYTITGQNVAGPALRPLDYMELEVRADGAIVVDTGRIHRREQYDPRQATRV